MDFDGTVSPLHTELWNLKLISIQSKYLMIPFLSWILVSKDVIKANVGCQQAVRLSCIVEEEDSCL